MTFPEAQITPTEYTANCPRCGDGPFDARHPEDAGDLCGCPPQGDAYDGDNFTIEWIGAADGRIHAVEVQPDKVGGSYLRIKPPGGRSYWVSLVHLFGELYPNGLSEHTLSIPDLPMRLDEPATGGSEQ